MNNTELKSWRESFNLSRSQAAGILGTSEASMCRWEMGKVSIPGPLTLLIEIYRAKVIFAPCLLEGNRAEITELFNLGAWRTHFALSWAELSALLGVSTVSGYRYAKNPPESVKTALRAFEDLHESFPDLARHVLNKRTGVE